MRCGFRRSRPTSARRAEHGRRALTLVADEPPSRSKFTVLLRAGFDQLFAGEAALAAPYATAALATADELEAADLRADALNLRAQVRRHTGDFGGLSDAEAAAELAATSGSPIVMLDALGNLGIFYLELGDLTRGYRVSRDARELAVRIS
jgi:hypothetical protein